MRTLDVEAQNPGNVTWPGGWHAEPLIRVAHRWLVHELERSFHCAIRVPIDVVDSR